jgi:hypothetical protein
MRRIAMEGGDGRLRTGLWKELDVDNQVNSIEEVS